MKRTLATVLLALGVAVAAAPAPAHGFYFNPKEITIDKPVAR